ncbi:hypothetical protein APHAL10511_003235 [Amanita phalloides]|nr:hypothetical protein APHAL10511_003235 [Amanita phalloides]
MFKLFRLRRSQELSPASHVMTGCRTPHADQDNHGSTPLWLQRGNYTFTMTSDMAVPVALHTPQEPDCFDRATHGRPAEILDDDNVAWNTPPTRNQ